MKEKPHRIIAALHSNAVQGWRVLGTCGRCGRSVVLAIDDCDLPYPGEPPRAVLVHHALDAHCGIGAAGKADTRGRAPDWEAAGRAIEELRQFEEIRFSYLYRMSSILGS